VRYMTESELLNAVQNGRTIEQFLAPLEEVNYRVLRWVCVKKDGSGTFSVSRYKVFDEGDLDHLDLYSFSFVDPDEPREEHSGMSSLEATLTLAEEQLAPTNLNTSAPE